MFHLIFDRYWDICLLKESPENTSYSISRMVLSGFFLALLIMIEWDLTSFKSSDDVVSSALISIFLIFSDVIYTYLVLSFKGFAARLVQVVTSLFVINIIIHLLVLPLLLIAPYLSQFHLRTPLFLFLGIIYLFLSLGLSVWQFVITANIYKFALNVTMIQAVLTAFGLVAVNILTVSLLQ
ncbi:hypothetical protein Lsai_0492 [Legionella sainthelensi]|uniref:Uncharacterized protein n=1 Tax=Legionella sainthelensi TaxID=28087 RepID=A0A0W0YSH2_9GAMM|nr:hypothetical protein [Legionella sainthelensi]KTD59848.1 hypothetical protein Lsai_0492 [Legionella sainthelensi]VEH31237.1 Uncharacterised protein [Legionella sainthelensi]